VFNDIITLVGITKTVTTYGDAQETLVKRDVFAELKSITQNEFYQASAVGLKPTVKVIIADYLDYHGEDVVEYAAFGEEEVQTYSVLRTYRDGNRMELTLARGVDK